MAAADLTAEDKHRILKRLREWADTHPYRGRPVLSFRGVSLSPDELVKAVTAAIEAPDYHPDPESPLSEVFLKPPYIEAGRWYLNFLSERSEQNEPIDAPLYRAVLANKSSR